MSRSLPNTGLCILTCCLLWQTAPAQKTDRRLQSQLDTLVKEFPGDAGIFVKNLRTGRTASYHADSVFPTASMVKVAILTGILQKIAQGELQYHQPMVYNDSLLYKGVDILGSFKNGEQIELSKLMMLMITMSDNTASLWLQRLAGGGARINQLLDSLGFIHYRVNARTPGREQAHAQYGWGQTTPREMVMMFEKIHAGQILSPAASERMLRLLGRDYWDEEAISQIPPDVFVACKSGSLDDYRSETVLVMAPHGPYLFCVIANHLQDTSWTPGNAGWVLARRLSRLLWQTYEPHAHWQPSVDVEGKPE